MASFRSAGFGAGGAGAGAGGMMAGGAGGGSVAADAMAEAAAADVLYGLDAMSAKVAGMEHAKGVSTGTSIIAVEFDGGVVLGADSRTSTGIYVANRVSDKLTQVHDTIYCCRSGSAADTQAVADYARRYLADYAIELDGPPSVKAASTLFRAICYNNKNALMAGIIIAGYDPEEGGQVYAIPLGGTCVRQKVAFGGSGSTYIYGWVDERYRPGMNRDECIQFVRDALSHAMARDGSSGGVIRTVCIDKNGAQRDFVAGDKLPFSFEVGGEADGDNN